MPQIDRKLTIMSMSRDARISLVAKNRLKSSWTPLSNEDHNHQIFEERRQLVSKWFDKWTDEQRKKILEDLTGKCRKKQLEFTADIVNKKVPIYHQDFTRVLPRVLSLYLFSFLDPRSLCRSSRVCWYWKFLAESDEIWMGKCMRLGWYLPFTPSPYERGLWKKHYVETIRGIQYIRPKEYPKPESTLPPPSEDMESMTIHSPKDDHDRRSRRPPRPRSGKDTPTSSSRKPAAAVPGKPPPWKGSDPTPKDTWRYNYLDNEDEVEKVSRLRKKGFYSAETEQISKEAKSKVKTGKNVLNTKIVTNPRRSRSLTREDIEQHNQEPTTPFLWNSYHRVYNYLGDQHVGTDFPTDGSTVGSDPGSGHARGDGRPDWAKVPTGAPFMNSAAHLDASRRPPPVLPVPRVKAVRTERDTPSSPLFEQRPWQVPRGTGSDDEAPSDEEDVLRFARNIEKYEQY
ncbi:F-box only protein 16 isoform X1 [Lingula anatina]|uniref:F-box only protein 16 isoform X1 n=1 Tax=Lingula anatina TaxID=7574 RepID=A0A2R2MSZ9_LINAN|nr:F-box only protein 16 isoform X1 [Lingula anatina]|eukprot:XP_023933376.1 F-box only protein 16 isoform X1 [Lingula anatina]